MDSQLRLVSRDHAEYVARLVYAGDRYGPEGRLVSNERRTLVEFVRPCLGGDRFVTVVLTEALTEQVDWHGKGIGIDSIALPPRQLDRLRRWIACPSSVEDTAALFVGDCDEISKTLIALAPLQLDAFRERGGAAAVARVRRLPPRIAIIGEGIRGLETLEVVRRMCQPARDPKVRVVVVGGDEVAATEAGAVLHVPTPLNYTTLVSSVAALLGFL